jgi:hypothetical protein
VKRGGCFVLLLLLAGVLSVAAVTLEEVRAKTLRPYVGEAMKGVDVSTLKGKLVCGYQGWFNCEGDGAERGWNHWTKAKGPVVGKNVKVDLWPDVSEYGADELYATGLKMADGSAARVFSSHSRPTVLRHFQWMREYGIDGAMVQRFASGLKDPRVLRHNNVVLDHCRAGAHVNGRGYAVMYDLTGMGAGRLGEVMTDWKALREQMKLGADAAYLHHEGKPLVAVWGVGFGDDRKYTLGECAELVAGLKVDGCAVMLGTPTYWRELKRDAAGDAGLHALLKLADVVSPWTVGRYNSPKGAANYVEQVAKEDAKWCASAGVDFLPVVFPGFSWHNMYGAELNAIPRLKGEFLRSQLRAHLDAGADMLYVAMFDEVDEATAIFKCTNEVPVDADAEFVTYEGLPSDYYLKLVGEAAAELKR